MRNEKWPEMNFEFSRWVFLAGAFFWPLQKCISLRYQLFEAHQVFDQWPEINIELNANPRDEISTRNHKKWLFTFWIFFSCSSCSEVRFSDSAKNCFRSSILCRSRSWICRLSSAACCPNSAPFSRRSAFSFSMSRCCSRKIRSNSCLSRCAKNYIIYCAHIYHVIYRL